VCRESAVDVMGSTLPAEQSARWQESDITFGRVVRMRFEGGSPPHNRSLSAAHRHR
jgi:hypothetical protein